LLPQVSLINLDVKLAVANFGKIPYDKQVHGKMVLSDPIDACQPVNAPLDEYSFILVAQRGKCTFVTKANYA
jgi:hypothetical protein